MAYDLTPFGRPAASAASRTVGGLVAVGAHVAFALFLFFLPETREAASQWVDMVVNEPKPPPPPPPEEKPPDEKPKPKPKPIDARDIPKTPPPETPPPVDAPPPTAASPARRVVQGLSANSFATGGTTGLSVNAGNSLATGDSKDKMSIQDAAAPRAYTDVQKQARIRTKHDMVVPPEAQKAAIAGEIKVSLTIGADGHVKAVKILKDLGYGTGDACRDAWMGSTFVPAEHNGVPVEVLNYPQACIVAIQD